MKNPGRVYLPGECIVIDCNCHETYFVFLCGIVVIPLTDFFRRLITDGWDSDFVCSDILSSFSSE